MVRLLPPFRGEKQWHYHHQPSTILELWQHENDTWTQSLFTLWHCRCSLHKVYIRANRLNTYNMSKLNSYFRVRCCEIIQNVSFEYHQKKNHRKIREILLSFKLQNTFHFDEIFFTTKLKIRILIWKRSHLKIRESLFRYFDLKINVGMYCKMRPFKWFSNTVGTSVWYKYGYLRLFVW